MPKPLTIQYVAAAIVSVLIFSSCNDRLSSPKPAILTTENLPIQTFSINGSKDTILKGKSGTILNIHKNTFADSGGKIENGPIAITLKEAINSGDIVLSGLTTTSAGRFLQTGGMIYVDATSAKGHLTIADGKSIGLAVPTAKAKKNMNLFAGVEDSAGQINWIDPVPILNHATPAPAIPIRDSIGRKKTHDDDVDDIIAYIKTDTSQIRNQEQHKKVATNDNQTPEVTDSSSAGVLNIEATDNSTGTNAFAEDNNTNYIFDLKKLGWANIDRLWSDPRTKEIHMTTSIENQQAYDKVYITLVIKNQNMYLPGYKRQDSTFSFTHNDEEPCQLPIGEDAEIFVTAYNKDIVFYGLQKIKIAEKQSISIKLKSTTMEQLEDVLLRQL